jgi:AAA family ATP:ADP antiporter
MQSRDDRGLMERFLSLFTEVRRGETASALLLTFNIFLILTAYYIMKPVREALILSTGGAELKSYMTPIQMGIFLFYVPLYAKLASILPRRKLLNYVTLFFVACLAAFFLLGRMDVPLGVAFYLWIGIFNISVVAQFWSFANDIYSPEQGKRLFVIVVFGQSAGAVLGPQIASVLIEPLGPYQLLLLSGAVLGLSLFATNTVESRGSGVAKAAESPSSAPPREEPMGREGAYKLVFGSGYLLGIAMLILFLNWVNTNGEYILGRVVTAAAEAAVAADPSVDIEIYIGKFYANFFKIVNIVGLLVQLILVSRILKYFGVRVALLVLPIIAFAGYALAVVYPVLGMIRWIKTAENATDYSLQNTLRGVLFLPTTREEKYKAKQAIDTLFVRAGDLLSTALVLLGTAILTFRTEHFAMVNLGLLVVWIVLAIRVGGRFMKMTKDSAAKGS